MGSGLAPSTTKQNTAGQRKYNTFCEILDVPSVPASEVTILRFIASQSKQVSAVTIQNYLAAIRSLHIMQGFANPFPVFERVRLVMRALKKRSKPSRQRSPVTPAMLSKISSQLNASSYEDILFWCAICVGFFGFLRVSEFTVDISYNPSFHLSIEDISFLPLISAAVVKIKQSKTDPFRIGASITLGATGTNICPVKALIAYLKRRGLSKGPLFRFENGTPMSRSWFQLRLKKACSISGFSGDFTTHSLRIGAATAAAAAGIPAPMIQKLGRWTSNAFKLYIRTPKEDIAALSRRLLVG